MRRRCPVGHVDPLLTLPDDKGVGASADQRRRHEHVPQPHGLVRAVRIRVAAADVSAPGIDVGIVGRRKACSRAARRGPADRRRRRTFLAGAVDGSDSPRVLRSSLQSAVDKGRGGDRRAIGLAAVPVDVVADSAGYRIPADRHAARRRGRCRDTGRCGQCACSTAASG